MPTMLTIRKASEETGLSYHCIMNLIKQGEIVFIKSGTKYLVNMQKLAEYLDTGGKG